MKLAKKAERKRQRQQRKKEERERQEHEEMLKEIETLERETDKGKENMNPDEGEIQIINMYREIYSIYLFQQNGNCNCH